MSENTEKIKALKPYLKHKRSCAQEEKIALGGDNAGESCTCGLDQALALLAEKPDEQQEIQDDVNTKIFHQRLIDGHTFPKSPTIDIEKAIDLLRFIINRENLTFAECCDAEDIMKAAKQALSYLMKKPPTMPVGAKSPAEPANDGTISPETLAMVNAITDPCEPAVDKPKCPIHQDVELSASPTANTTSYPVCIGRKEGEFTKFRKIMEKRDEPKKD